MSKRPVTGPYQLLTDDRYLGDGVSVSFDGSTVAIEISRGSAGTIVVRLSPEICRKLGHYADDLIDHGH